ncbi:MAG: LppM family (lipo)protein [Candidatus Nanopelagicales bacterium]
MSRRAQVIRRSGGMLAVAVLAVAVLSSCMNITYSLVANPDATVSGTLQLQVAKEAASMLGIATAEDLATQLKSGELTDAGDSKVLDNCVSGSDETYIVLNCGVTNAPLTDIDDGWSLVREGDTLVMQVRTDSGATGEEPTVDLGEVTITVTFPGDVISVEGNGVTKTAPDTIVAKGSIDETLDFTVTASALGAGAGGMVPIWILLIGFIVVIGALALLLFLRRRSASPAPIPADDEKPVDETKQVD